MSKKISARRIALVSMSLAALWSGSATAGTTAYVYDTQGRVIQVTYPNGTVVTYTYDKSGNRTQATKTP
ncbi:RHS repeat domain-containing protein [Asticcacaulis sp. AND118]|uniref:RHS repeat domain-containing protein n=1 Tax=Asticcacaulis sp. AND118 TaxID=2840468 RepID=UPI001CFFA3C1|nr:RHS repeat domain-containing protein [Asticcacaulis sp. AND118]UDF05218.1 RHS repeat protein [Asticcacaulis sp. AND118]